MPKTKIVIQNTGRPCSQSLISFLSPPGPHQGEGRLEEEQQNETQRTRVCRGLAPPRHVEAMAPAEGHAVSDRCPWRGVNQPENHFFLRGRPLLAEPLFAFAAAAEVLIRKSSRFLPSLMAAAIQLAASHLCQPKFLRRDH